MLYRRFGKTGLTLPVLSLGGMRFPKGWEAPHDSIPDETMQNALRIVEYSFSKGINHYETARGYGRSEKIYGLVLKALGFPRERFLVTTKIGPTATYKEMRDNIDESLERLQVEYIDNFDIHGINTQADMDMTLKKGGCLEAVRDAMAEGLIRHLGFSTHAPCSLIMDIINTDEFESVNLHYYYFFQVNRPAVALASYKDMGVFIISPTEKGGLLFRPPEKLERLCSPLTPVEMNDRWLLSQPEVHTLSCGAFLPQHIDQHLGALNPGPIPSEQDRDVFSRLGQAMAGVKDYCTECQLCLPCPEDIRIPEILRMRNMAEGFDMVDFGRFRYNQMRTGDKWYGGNFGDKCTECGDCLPRCPVELNIPSLLHQTHSLLSK